MAGLETRAWVRSARLAGVPLRAAGRAGAAAVRRTRGPQERLAVRAAVRRANAADLRRVLGDLKGGALKAGQFVSTVDSLFPPDADASWQEALTALQERNPGLAAASILPEIEAAVGPIGTGPLRSLEPDPVAAASLGQVHRGVWHDGQPVAVKVQYPGAAQAVAADLRILGVALRAASLVARGLVVPPVLGELRTRTLGELDYRAEAQVQERFAVEFDGDPEVAVPHVLHATATVLVSQWLPGAPLVSAASDDDARRALVGSRYQGFALGAPARVGVLHADPHPGNYRVLPDGRLGVLDFGAVVPMPGGLPVAFGALVRAFAQAADDRTGPGGAREQDLLRALRDAGLVAPGRRIDVVSLAQVMAPFSEPARHEVFGYSPEWLRSCFERNPQARDPDYTVALGLRLPPEHLMTQRVWLGVVGTLCRLRATVPVAPVLRAHLPGFAGPVTR